MKKLTKKWIKNLQFFLLQFSFWNASTKKPWKEFSHIYLGKQWVNVKKNPVWKTISISRWGRKTADITTVDTSTHLYSSSRWGRKTSSITIVDTSTRLYSSSRWGRKTAGITTVDTSTHLYIKLGRCWPGMMIVTGELGTPFRFGIFYIQLNFKLCPTAILCIGKVP